MSGTDQPDRPGIVIRGWRFFFSPSARLGWGVIFMAGGLSALVLWAGFSTFMAYSNTLDFCTSCHEMEQNVYREYKKTVHYSNRTGVRVICSDCHVPRQWAAKLVRKIQATNELYHWLLGSIDTAEKFEAQRLEMAERVWAKLERNDSLACRNCHTFEAMDFSLQGRRPKRKHPQAKKEGKTCINCHKGIAHRLPEDFEDDD
jgi:nitrate/TMAO reductase-like tetraheme cytochrome c subunit